MRIPDYFSELRMAEDRGADDRREGKELDQRMRAYCKQVPAWNDGLWAAYRTAYMDNE